MTGSRADVQIFVLAERHRTGVLAFVDTQLNSKHQSAAVSAALVNKSHQQRLATVFL